jgi:hypothetical protein
MTINKLQSYLLASFANSAMWHSFEAELLAIEEEPGLWQCDDFADVTHAVLEGEGINHAVIVGMVLGISHVWVEVVSTKPLEDVIVDPSRDQFGFPGNIVPRAEYRAEDIQRYWYETRP